MGVGSMMVQVRDTRVSERGSALVYILIAIALLAALTLSFMEPSGQQTQSQNTFKTISEIESQAEYIRTAIQECVILHEKGDNTIDNSPTGSDPGANKKFPIKPTSTHFTGATPPADADDFVEYLRCPGNPGDDNNHKRIFTAETGKFLPPPPPLFEKWEYYNGDDGIFFWTHTTKSDSYLQTALAKLEEKFGKCEADTIVAGGSAVDLDTDGGVECPANSTCFRVWMTIKGSPAVFQEAGCPN